MQKTLHPTNSVCYQRDITDLWNNIYNVEIKDYEFSNFALKYHLYIFNRRSYSCSPKEKFHYLNSVLSNIFLPERDKDSFFTYFSLIQKRYHALSRFAFLCKFKKANIQINTDIFLNPIESHHPHVMTLLQNNKKYLFTLTDLVNIINTALGNTDFFFAQPLTIKNPYNNLPFQKSTLLDVSCFRV
jgi:hypothetical protein